MKIKIYAPVDCDVKSIGECSDETFAQKMLGDGLVIIPKNGSFKSFLESSKVAMIADTKHAIFLESQNLKFLMHIGLETVNLNGKPFNILVEEKEEVSLSEALLNVNLDLIEKEGLSNETVICVDQQNVKKLKVLILKQNAKQGDLIAEIEIELIDKPIKEIGGNIESDYTLLNRHVGGSENVDSHLNCVTRFRFNIINKDLVNIKELKQISFVRGINWSGNQLQVIIGPEVNKVRDKYISLFETNGSASKKLINKQKFQFKRAFVDFISNVMLPTIPILMVGGMGQALFAILTITKAVDPITTSNIPNLTTDQNLISGSLFVITNTALQFIGMFMCFNTVKYMKGNLPMGVLVALAIASPFLYPGKAWVLFTVGPVDIKFQGYTTMIFPQIAAAFIYVYLDRWIKTWIPAALDIILRHFMAFFITCGIMFFVAGPILGLVETGVFYIFNSVQKIPYGIGIGIFGFAWTFLVLTGMHLALATAMMSGFLSNPEVGSTLLALTTMTSITTIATCAAVGIQAKENNIKTIAFGALVPGAFGISEPTYYSISMIRPILFVPVVVARGLTGVLIGLLDLRWYQPGGRGVLGFTSAISVFADSWNLPKYFICMAFIFVVCFALTMLVYKERKNEKREYFKLFKVISKISNQLGITEISEMKNNINQMQNKDYLRRTKILEKKVVASNNKKYLLEKYSSKENLKDSQKLRIEKETQQINSLEKEIKAELKIVDKDHLAMYDLVMKKIKSLNDITNESLNTIGNVLFNISHGLEVNYKLLEGYDNNFSDLKKLKIKKVEVKNG
ncbi:PTS system, beta-glucoside-specific IIA component [Spiroplasma chinense]|uniref:PTS system, beta-glucoside-specific IIA component n=1 Tax=Spiroplasma chinense TaxID=216932 RepID=A0A5B9Y4R1_9MOLU|nr:PTS glucose transporter subunit IIA [Spiroplasma chinense]QEH61247.1 PTS system, beta-glucoside-specific IIA component [Spiroplasma chinense]